MPRRWESQKYIRTTYYSKQTSLDSTTCDCCWHYDNAIAGFVVLNMWCVVSDGSSMVRSRSQTYEVHRQPLQVVTKPDCEVVIFIRIVELMCFPMWLLHCSSKVSRDFETREIFWTGWTDLKSCSRGSTAQLINILTANAARCDLGTMCVYMVDGVSTYGSASSMIFLKQWFLYGWWWKGELVGNWA